MYNTMKEMRIRAEEREYIRHIQNERMCSEQRTAVLEYPENVLNKISEIEKEKQKEAKQRYPNRDFINICDKKILLLQEAYKKYARV